MRIAVVGAGITGLSAAWLLASRHDVTLIEGQYRIGGHSNTVDVATPDGSVPVDTGFIVYNTPSYPNLVALFAHLDVPTADSNMSFGVSLNAGRLEYCGTGLNGMFAQRSNIFRPSHWRMTADIVRFHREARALAAATTEAGAEAGLTLGAWLQRQRYSQVFIARHILPMAAAIWSAPADAMLAFPAVSFARFFDNHGLLTAYNQPVWRTVQGGSRAYVAKLRAVFQGITSTGDPVTAVQPEAAGVRVTLQSGHSQIYDRVALCCHADEALTMLGDATPTERRVLGSFSYSNNRAVLHTDANWMPKRRAVWSSWNYISSADSGPLTLTYWMNSLQPLATKTNIFVTLNPDGPMAPGTQLATFDYTHPLFDMAALKAQAAIWDLQGSRNVWFAGAYCGYGFHEDGLQAGLAIAEDMTRDHGPVTRPWSVANPSGRLALATAPRRSAVRGTVMEAV